MIPDSTSKEEKFKVLKEWNSTDKAYPLDKCLHAFIEEQVFKTPFARALTYGGNSLSYEDLNTQANQLAHYLKSKGVGPETLVGICAYRSAEMVIGLLAILKAGGAYVPFDPTYPAGRLEFMINDSKVPIILAQKSCDAILPKASADIIYFEDTANIINSYPTSNPKIEVRPENLDLRDLHFGINGQPQGSYEYP